MVANPLYVEQLRELQERSSEGSGIPIAACEEAGVDDEALRALRQEGLVEVVEDDGEPTLIVTEQGREMLRP
jgi:hypothetical protein